MDAPALSIEVIAQLCDRAAAGLSEPLLGLRLAEDLPRGTYGVIEFAARNAPTVRRAAERLVRYQRLINDAVVYEVVDDGSATEVRHFLPGYGDGVGLHGNLFTLASLHRLLRELGVSTAPTRVDVANLEPQPELDDTFGNAEVRFGAGHNALRFPPSVFDARIPDADASLLPVLDGYAARLLPPEDPASGWRARVRDHLRRNLSGGAPSLEETAAHLSTSPRNLQRQLGAQKLSYSKVVDALREEEARRLVVDQSLSIAEIAFLLGYSDARAFLRAFKRWTGKSPGNFRGPG
jgi:AraC-like DNA-binding protein